MAVQSCPVVIVDLEGSTNLTAGYAISQAGSVLIPLRGKWLGAFLGETYP